MATSGAVTLGLQAFIGREMEFVPAPFPSLQELARRVFAGARYFILNGPVVKDGDVVGLSIDDKFRARLKDAGLRPGIRVVELTLEHLDADAVRPGSREAGSSDAVPQGGESA